MISGPLSLPLNAEFTVKLWHHPAWGHFKGFGTNTDETALLFDGMGVIRQQ